MLQVSIKYAVGGCRILDFDSREEFDKWYNNNQDERSFKLIGIHEQGRKNKVS